MKLELTEALEMTPGFSTMDAAELRVFARACMEPENELDDDEMAVMAHLVDAAIYMENAVAALNEAYAEQSQDGIAKIIGPQFHLMTVQFTEGVIVTELDD